MRHALKTYYVNRANGEFAQSTSACEKCQQLRRQNYCSRETSPVELFFGPAAQSICYLWTVQMTAEGTPFWEAFTLCSVIFWYAGAIKKHLLTYIANTRAVLDIKLFDVVYHFVTLMITASDQRDWLIWLFWVNSKPTVSISSHLQ